MRGQTYFSKAIVGASALFMSVAAVQPAAAQQYSASPAYTQAEAQCQASQNRRMVGGALIGAIAGAVLGNNAAAGGHQGDGTALGGVLGAAAGAAIGRSTANCAALRQESYNQPGYNQPAPPPPRPYADQRGPYDQRGYQSRDRYGDESGLDGGPYRRSSYRGGYDQSQCRWNEVTVRDESGYPHRDRVYMCRGRDGAWRPQ